MRIALAGVPDTYLNIHTVCLANLTSLYNYSSPIVENEWKGSYGDLQCTI